MKNKKEEKPEPPVEEFELIVAEEDYRRGLKRGRTDDDMLKPGRHKFRLANFLARYPELKDKMRKCD
ncbi:MAG TPA: hypothetical protein VF611_09180 [Pyrinomonadaceae bacterium]|jgi:hypothetical protein